MVTTHICGHKLQLNTGGLWVYTDIGEPAIMVNSIVTDNRPCARCGRPPTRDGHDACLGEIPGVLHACCGHGMEEPYVIKEER